MLCCLNLMHTFEICRPLLKNKIFMLKNLYCANILKKETQLLKKYLSLWSVCGSTIIIVSLNNNTFSGKSKLSLESGDLLQGAETFFGEGKLSLENRDFHWRWETFSGEQRLSMDSWDFLWRVETVFEYITPFQLFDLSVLIYICRVETFGVCLSLQRRTWL